MAKKGQLIGWKNCHDCGDKQCEVKLDKSGNPYGICFECQPPSQDMTYGRPARLERFKREGFRPVDPANPPAWAGGTPAPAPQPQPEPETKPAPQKKPRSLMDVD